MKEKEKKCILIYQESGRFRWKQMGEGSQVLFCCRAFYRRQEKEPDLLAEYVEKGYDSRQMMRMTHMDVFRYPVWDRNWLGGAKLSELYQEEERFVLFDYEKRNPLNHEAAYIVIDEV